MSALSSTSAFLLFRPVITSSTMKKGERLRRGNASGMGDEETEMAQRIRDASGCAASTTYYHRFPQEKS